MIPSQMLSNAEHVLTKLGSLPVTHSSFPRSFCHNTRWIEILCLVRTWFTRWRGWCRCLTPQSLASMLSMGSGRRRRRRLLPQVVVFHQLWLHTTTCQTQPTVNGSPAYSLKTQDEVLRIEKNVSVPAVGRIRTKPKQKIILGWQVPQCLIGGDATNDHLSPINEKCTENHSPMTHIKVPKLQWKNRI